MRRGLVLALALLVGCAQRHVGFRTWDEARAYVLRSVERLELYGATGELEGGCTAFSINEAEAFWMTANHCLYPDMRLKGSAAWEVYKSAEHDVAVLYAPGFAAPALWPAEQVLAGEEIAAIGFPWLQPTARVLVGHLSVVGAVAPPESGLTETDTYSILNLPLMFGMSGGPMVNKRGEVVSINQATQESSDQGVGRDLSVMYAATARYWEHSRD